MSVKLNSSGGGSVTLQEPATATNGTLTLPAGTGTVAVNGLSSNIVSDTAKASTTGAVVDFTGIPSWVKRVTVIFNGVSLTATDNLLVQLGTSGGFVITGYFSTGSAMGAGGVGISTSTAGLLIRTSGATSTFAGHMVITLVSGFTYISSHAGARDTTGTLTGGGSITLASALTQVRIAATGTDTFDAGSINIMYE